ncbi:hypothetical protein D3C76_717570 [compost metagenome]
MARDLLGQRMLERILHLRKCGPLVNELRSLQSGEQVTQIVVHPSVPPITDALDQTERKLFADNGEGLQQFLLRNGEAVDTGGENTLHSGGNMQRSRSLLDPVTAGFAEQRFLLDQRLHHFLHEERVALRLIQDELFEGGEGGIVPKQGCEQCLCFGRAQRFEPQLAAMIRARPHRLILGPVVHEEQDRGARQVVDQVHEECFGLAVQPLQILEQQFDRLIAALARQQLSDRVEGAIAPDLRIHFREH